MGDGGLRLHHWLFNASTGNVDSIVAQEMFASTGAVVLGRRTFDVGIDEWDDTPFPAPCFVPTHQARERSIAPCGKREQSPLGRT